MRVQISPRAPNGEIAPKVEQVIEAHRVGGSSPSLSTIMALYSVKDTGQSVKLLSFDWLGARPRKATIGHLLKLGEED